MIRFLEQNTEDAFFFDEALNHYLKTNNHEHSGYTYEGQKKFVDIHKELFRTADPKSYFVLADVGAVIHGMAIGFTHSLLLSRPNMHLTPTWHLAFTWRGQREWSSPKQWLFDITNPISLMMESRGVNEFTKVMRASPMIRKIGPQAYIDRVYNRNVPDGRYNAYMMSYIDHSTDLDRLDMVTRKTLPDEITTPLIVVKHVLKNELRSIFLPSLRKATVQHQPATVDS